MASNSTSRLSKAEAIENEDIALLACDDSSSETLFTSPSAAPSPTPSAASSASSASVFASDDGGDADDDGFADVAFPARAEDLRFGDAANSDARDAAAANLARFADRNDADDDLAAGFYLPDDFSWCRAGGDRGASAFKAFKEGTLKPSIYVGSELDAISPASTLEPANRNIPPKHAGKSMIMSKPIKAMDFGDGTELDSLDDISETDSVPVPAQVPQKHPIPLKMWSEQPERSERPESRPSSPVLPMSQIPVIKSVSLINQRKPKLDVPSKPIAKAPTRPSLSGLLGSSLRRSDTNLNRWTNPTPPTPKPQKKKPTLIRNVNPADIAHVIGKMVYDPILQKWSGNEEVLLDFDKESPNNNPSAPPTPQKPKTRPALITNKGGLSKIPHVVGNMVFDPVKMCWVGNEEDRDVFAGLDDAGFTVTEADQDAQKYFTLTKSMKQSLYVAESSHKLFIGKWYPKAVQEAKTLTRDTSKSHLYDIRSHIL
ncbi:hypothetical protein BDR26DRAFT_864666 [Obelidium mucronatum]|nr:hypothetical protein BDR26DRAFT_864666 [Obelidium mucronatum]